MTVKYDIGPQYERDEPFTARMRLHQSWYRANVLRVPYGTGPTQNSKRLLGSMLKSEHGEQGLNFLTPEIYEGAKIRMSKPGAVEPFRLLHNMLSSQPMCFNLFAPLAMDLELATRTFKRIIPGIADVTSVKIEYAPEPENQYIDDSTAFDAFLEFKLETGKIGFIGIETKLTEPFSQKEYDYPAYRRWSVLPDSPWPEQHWPVLSNIEYNQLWRGHLLCFSMVKHHNRLYDCGYFMLLRHPLDTQCLNSAEAYKKILKTADQTFFSYDLSSFLKLIETPMNHDHTKEWAKAFRDRYLNLSLSD